LRFCAGEEVEGAKPLEKGDILVGKGLGAVERHRALLDFWEMGAKQAQNTIGAGRGSDERNPIV
jgi:hypothetical protein